MSEQREAHRESCHDALSQPRRPFNERRARYDWAAYTMYSHGLSDRDTVLDLGAGWTELDYALRSDLYWRGRYVPIDGAIDGTDLKYWRPQYPVEWIVLLEVIEHLPEHNWRPLVAACQKMARKGVLISTPNPDVVDVLAQDPTHVCAVEAQTLTELGFTVIPRNLYGQENDGLTGFARW